MPLISRYLSKVNQSCGTNYRISARVVDAADYGVPQRRRRAVLIITRDGSDFVWPMGPNRDDHVSAWQAIGNLEEGRTVQWSAGRWGDLLPSIPEGSNYIWHTSHGGGLSLFGYRRRYWSFLLKLSKCAPAWTIPAQPGPSTGPFHWASRPLSIPELQRLQSFPDDWRIEGSPRSQVRQLGNATPPLLAEHLARAIGRHLGFESPELPPVVTIPRDEIPSPERPAVVPERYLAMVGAHEAHPGHGKGPGALSRRP
jgi:DNA (cytosine-5)-methyltransferase 1